VDANAGQKQLIVIGFRETTIRRRGDGIAGLSQL